MTFTAVVMAAGQGTRMRSAMPKVLHEMCGRPLVAWPVLAAQAAGAGSVVVVTAPGVNLDGALPEGARTAEQPEADGTGGAVAAALSALGDAEGPVVVLSGDVPLISREAIEALVAEHAREKAAATIVTTELEDPSGYGRVVHAADGSVEKVVETKHPGDASDEELQIREINAGIYCFEPEALEKALAEIGTHNAGGERYLTDVVAVLRGHDEKVAALRLEDPALVLGINDRAQLAQLRAIAQERILDAHMRAGVTIVDPRTTLVDAQVTIGADTVIEPSTYLRGKTTIGERSAVGPNTTVIDSKIGDAVTIRHSYLQEAQVDDNASVGPFAYLRPKAHLHENAKAGTFVEIKNSEIGPGTKVPHLSYIGDADVGENSNLGAATITANYDGRAKHRTTIGRNVRTSVDTTLVAPVDVGDDATTGAGSVITDDVPPGALGIARERQTNIEGYADRKQEDPER